MTTRFFDVAFTPAVQDEQARHGSRTGYARAAARRPAQGPDVFTPHEAELVASVDTFFIATVSESGWPYVQHRGGDAGFVQVLSAPEFDGTVLAWGEFVGNRQYVTAGNTSHDDRAALIFIDFTKGLRLKVMGHLRLIEPSERPDLMRQVWKGDTSIERLMLVQVEAFDWNCHQHITPRFTLPEINAMGAERSVNEPPR